MAWQDAVQTSARRPIMVGIAALAVGFLGFGVWAATAPLESAVIAQGAVVASGRNKEVQHLEGGIVKSILVKEGQHVAAGEPIMLLDSTAAEVTRNRVQAQLYQLQAVEARALAERDGRYAAIFPQELLSAARESVPVAGVIADQRAEFAARLERYSAELGILEQQIAALNEEITGLKAQKQATSIQLDLIKEEKSDAEELLKQSLTRKSAVLELKRSEADLIGRQGKLTADIAKAKQTIAEAQQQVQRLKAKRLEEASASLADVRLKRSDLLEQLRSAQDVLDRVKVRAPASGIVMDLTKTGGGAVIAPGETLMEIVPDGVALVVEAHVRPSDIDEVHLGQDARLVFTALDRRSVPPVDGKVIHVSADSLEDRRTGEHYYLARLAIAKDLPPGFDPRAIGPGQPVEAFITTGERTFIAYLVKPLATTLRRSLRER